MTHIYVSAVVPAPIAKVWSIIRDFNGLPNWHPSIAKSHIEDGLSGAEVGCIRNFELHDGGVIREKLLTLSDEHHSCTYAILESPMGVENYTATLRLTKVTEGDESFAEWWADFDCPPEREAELIETIDRGVFAAGFEALSAKM